MENNISVKVNKKSLLEDWFFFYNYHLKIPIPKDVFKKIEIPDLRSPNYRYLFVMKEIDIDDLFLIINNRLSNAFSVKDFFESDYTPIKTEMKGDNFIKESYITQFECGTENSGRGIAYGNPTLVEGMLLLAKHFYNNPQALSSNGFPQTKCTASFMKNGKNPEIRWDPYRSKITIRWIERGGF